MLSRLKKKKKNPSMIEFFSYCLIKSYPSYVTFVSKAIFFDVRYVQICLSGAEIFSHKHTDRQTKICIIYIMQVSVTRLLNYKIS